MVCSIRQSEARLRGVDVCPPGDLADGHLPELGGLVEGLEGPIYFLAALANSDKPLPLAALVDPVSHLPLHRHTSMEQLLQIGTKNASSILGLTDHRSVSH